MFQVREESVIGCLLGTAIGDSIGLPCEGIPRRRVQKLFGELRGHRFVLNKGMISDDTEHATMVAQALIESADDSGRFSRLLARQLKIWLLCLPAGVGFATLRAIIRLIIGYPPHKSGVFSAGNGPAMRSALIGILYEPENPLFRQILRESTRITHTDKKAELGAVAVALAAHLSAYSASEVEPRLFQKRLAIILGDEEGVVELLELAEKVAESASNGTGTRSFAAEIGLEKGVGGYIYHTLPIALHCWLTHQKEYSRAIEEIVSCGGDTDTVAAIVGGIIGARVGKSGIPDQWLQNLLEWPRSANWIEQVGKRLCAAINSGERMRPVPLFLPGVFARNIFFLIIVLLHGVRRLLPPY